MNLKTKINIKRPKGNSSYAWIAYLIGIAIAGGGVVFGVWLGVWHMLVGGVIQVIDAAKLTPVDSTGIAFGIAKVLFFEMGIGLPSILGMALGSFICAIAEIFEK